jgi:hypothetical protein
VILQATHRVVASASLVLHTADAMFVFATEHPVLAALAVLFTGWVVRFLQKGYTIRKTFHGQVCPIASMRYVLAAC